MAKSRASRSVLDRNFSSLSNDSIPQKLDTPCSVGHPHFVFLHRHLLLLPRTSSYFDPFLHWLFPFLTVEGREWIHAGIRKLGHWTEFFVFASLLARAFRSSSRLSLRTRWVLWTLLIIGFYASADEIHQLFVPSRTGSIKDSLLDFFGGCCAVLMIFFRSKNPAERE